MASASAGELVGARGCERLRGDRRALSGDAPTLHAAVTTMTESCRYCGEQRTRSLHLIRRTASCLYECWDVAACNKRRQLDMAFERPVDVRPSEPKGARRD